MLGFSLVGRRFTRATGLLAAGLTVWLAIGPGDASARTERAGDRRATPASKRETWVKPAPGPLIAVVSIAAITTLGTQLSLLWGKIETAIATAMG